MRTAIRHLVDSKDDGDRCNGKLGKHEPQNKEGDKGPKKPVKAARSTKEELLARMKAATAAKKAR
jgi:hypothetical protein